MKDFPERWERLVCRVWRRYYAQRMDLAGEKEDLLQQGRIACLESMPLFDPSLATAEEGFLWYRVRTAMQRLERSPWHRHRPASLEMLLEQADREEESTGWEPPDPTPGPEACVLLRDVCYRALHQRRLYGARRFRLLVRRLSEGWDQKEIAQAMGVNPSLLSKILRVNRERLRREDC